jgi:hypothetical protein
LPPAIASVERAIIKYFDQNKISSILFFEKTR